MFDLCKKKDGICDVVFLLTIKSRLSPRFFSPPNLRFAAKQK